MVIGANATTARLGPRIRLGLLLVISLLLAHDAIYLAQYGFGRDLAAAMSAGGHDEYWPALTGLAIASVLLLSVGSIVAISALRRRLAGTNPAPSAAAGTDPRYLTEVVRLWRVLLPATLLLFAVQENVEAFLTHGAAPGIEAIVGPAAPLAIPVLALVTFALAAVGGLVRWRIEILAARVARSLARLRHLVLDSAPAAAWRSIDALAPHRWTRSRLDAGRAPPLVLRP